MMKVKLIEIDLYFESLGDIAHLLLSIHDSVIFQTPLGPEGETIKSQVVKILEDVRGPPFKLRVPFVAEGGSGPNWAVATWGK